MADLLTPLELALWTSATVGKTEAQVAIDPFAGEVISKVSEMAQFLGGHPEWDLDAGDEETYAPFDVRIVVLQVCKRAYENPSQVVQEGNVGPLGGDRVLDVAALLLELTESERETLTKYNLGGDPNGAPGEGQIYTVPIETAPRSVRAKNLYINDDQQTGMTPDETAWPSQPVPVLHPNDIPDGYGQG